MKLLQMSLAGGVMILVITVIRALAIERLPKKTFLALWAAALARLLAPVSLPSALSIYSLLARPPVWTIVWAVGVAVCAVVFAVAYGRCSRTRTTPPPGSAARGVCGITPASPSP